MVGEKIVGAIFSSQVHPRYFPEEDISRGPISDVLFLALLQERLYPAEGIEKGY